MKNKSTLILFASFVLSAQATFADKKTDASIFKCINSKGAVYYNDKPCPKRDKETRIKAVKDPVNGVLTQAPLESPVFGKTKQTQVSVKIGGNVGKNKSGANQNLNIKELDGADAALEAENKRAERARMFAGASDADERRAAANDRMNMPPPVGSRRPAGSSANVIKLTEDMIDARIAKSEEKSE